MRIHGTYRGLDIKDYHCCALNYNLRDGDLACPSLYVLGRHLLKQIRVQAFWWMKNEIGECRMQKSA